MRGYGYFTNGDLEYIVLILDLVIKADVQMCYMNNVQNLVDTLMKLRSK